DEVGDRLVVDGDGLALLAGQLDDLAADGVGRQLAVAGGLGVAGALAVTGGLGLAGGFVLLATGEGGDGDGRESDESGSHGGEDNGTMMALHGKISGPTRGASRYRVSRPPRQELLRRQEEGGQGAP